MKILPKIIEDFEVIFFDLDGTLVFTEHLHEKAYKKACNQKGISYESLTFPVDKSLYLLKKNIYLDLLKQGPIEINRPIYEIYLQAFDKNKKVAIVSNTLHQNIDTILLSFNKRPDFVVSGEDFDKIKPFPDMYNFAIENLGARTEKILVFEDSDPGISAAISAGLKVMDVRTGVLYG